MDGRQLEHFSRFKYLGILLDESGTDGMLCKSVTDGMECESDTDGKECCIKVLSGRKVMKSDYL